MASKLIVPPITEPITVQDLKDHARITTSLHDGLLATCIAAARQMAETRMRVALCRQTWEVAVDGFSDAIELYPAPVLAVESVTYVDTTGADQVLPATTYYVDTKQRRGWLVPALNQSWPQTADVANAVRVRFRAGFSDSTVATDQQAAVPAAIKHWIKIAATVAYRHPEGMITGTIVSDLPSRFLDGLLDEHRRVVL